MPTVLAKLPALSMLNFEGILARVEVPAQQGLGACCCFAHAHALLLDCNNVPVRPVGSQGARLVA